jgi:lipoprotein signal peptidase
MKQYLGIVTIISFILSLLSSIATDVFIQKPYVWNGIGLQKAYNPGIAFSLHLGRYQSILIIAVLTFVVWHAFRAKLVRTEQIAFGLIIGGGLSNIIDRLHDGLVTDVLRVGNFPIFNIADSCITIGVCILFFTAQKTFRK